MAEPEHRTLSKRIIDRLSVDDKDAVFWDRDLPGFGIRVYPSGAKVYVVQSRAFGRSTRVTVGRHGELSAEQARREAAHIITRIKAGEPPALPEPAAAPTVRDLAERYEREYVAMHCKGSTGYHYGLMLSKHIVPALGELLVAEVERKHILALQYGLSDKPTVANRAVDILVHMFKLADAWGWRCPSRYSSSGVRNRSWCFSILYRRTSRQGFVEGRRVLEYGAGSVPTPGLELSLRRGGVGLAPFRGARDRLPLDTGPRRYRWLGIGTVRHVSFRWGTRGDAK